jgi:hypothetical protein
VTDLLIKLLIAGGALSMLYGAWQWDRHAQREVGRQDVIQAAQKAASAAQAKNVAVGQARNENAAQALFRHAERQKQQEADRAQEIAARAADQRLIARLRQSAVAGDRRAPDHAVDTCGPEHQRRDEAIDRLLAEGQQLAIEGGSLVAEGRELVGEGARGLAGSASLIELANDWARAVKLGEPRAPP